MILSANDVNAADYFLVDMDTREVIQNATWANDGTGEYTALVLDSCGSPILDRGNFVLQTVKGNIRIMKREEYYAMKEAN